VGWICAAPEVLAKFYMIKGNADLQTNSVAQAELNEYLETYDLDAHIEKIKALYHHRRDLMLGLMEKTFPAEARFTRPEGGLFTWVELPEWINTRELMHRALERKVAFVPGAPFFAVDSPENTLRLNFSNMPDERIIEGIGILAQVLADALARGAVGVER
jgi:DNA-binding transcriptional MocR family regulator